MVLVGNCCCVFFNGGCMSNGYVYVSYFFREWYWFEVEFF